MPGTAERSPRYRRERWTWRDTAFVTVVMLVGAGAARLTQDDGPAAIPGCDSVQFAAESESLIFVTSGGDDPGYNDPDYPWFSETKAAAIHDAVVAARPPDVRREDPGFDFVFPPVLDLGEDRAAESVTVSTVGGSTTASGQVARGDTRASISVDVREWKAPVPACVEGSVDRREVLRNGTVLDILEPAGHADSDEQHVVTAYVPGVSRVVAAVDVIEGPSRFLSTAELISMATTPGSAVAEDVPQAIRAMTSCGAFQVTDEWMLDAAYEDVVVRLNAVLDARWSWLGTSSVTLDRPLGSLVADGSGRGLCTDVVVAAPGATADLQIVIIASEFLLLENAEILRDGTLISRKESDGIMSVTIRHPSGDTVVMRVVPRTGSPLVIEQLELIARAPGLEIAAL